MPDFDAAFVTASALMRSKSSVLVKSITFSASVAVASFSLAALFLTTSTTDLSAASKASNSAAPAPSAAAWGLLVLMRPGHCRRARVAATSLQGRRGRLQQIVAARRVAAHGCGARRVPQRSAARGSSWHACLCGNLCGAGSLECCPCVANREL